MWTWVRVVAGAAVLLVIVGRLGTGPFLDGLRRTSPWAVAAALAVTALTTICSAWRWQQVARALGLELGLGAAVTAYYRSQFLNATLPGGVVGDVHRAVRHGSENAALGRAVRSVAWERFLGQATQVLLTVAALVAVPSPLRSPGLALALGGLVLVGAVLAAIRPLSADLRRILADPATALGVVISSALASTGHVLIFLLAIGVSGSAVSSGEAVPVALVVLLASAVPFNIAGWGPREGAAAWAFAAVGASAADGVAASVVYGVLALAATLPGAVVLLAGRRSNAPAPVLEEAIRG